MEVEKARMGKVREEVQINNTAMKGQVGHTLKKESNQIVQMPNMVMLMEIIIFQIYSVDLEEVEDPFVQVVPGEVRSNWLPMVPAYLN